MDAWQNERQTVSGNTINGEAAGAGRVLNGAAEDGGSDLAVVEE